MLATKEQVDLMRDFLHRERNKYIDDLNKKTHLTEKQQIKIYGQILDFCAFITDDKRTNDEISKRQHS